mmetsp:Transcript_46668/g.117574  ORF Transcript_46668/g.117574 Transcript_46668/m.117574 type:complete len:400 (+) Transcript_46668:46-1245(+)
MSAWLGCTLDESVRRMLQVLPEALNRLAGLRAQTALWRRNARGGHLGGPAGDLLLDLLLRLSLQGCARRRLRGLHRRLELLHHCRHLPVQEGVVGGVPEEQLRKDGAPVGQVRGGRARGVRRFGGCRELERVQSIEVPHERQLAKVDKHRLAGAAQPDHGEKGAAHAVERHPDELAVLGEENLILDRVVATPNDVAGAKPRPEHLVLAVAELVAIVAVVAVRPLTPAGLRLAGGALSTKANPDGAGASLGHYKHFEIGDAAVRLQRVGGADQRRDAEVVISVCGNALGDIHLGSFAAIGHQRVLGRVREQLLGVCAFAEQLAQEAQDGRDVLLAEGVQHGVAVPDALHLRQPERDGRVLVAAGQVGHARQFYAAGKLDALPDRLGNGLFVLRAKIIYTI